MYQPEVPELPLFSFTIQKRSFNNSLLTTMGGPIAASSSSGGGGKKKSSGASSSTSINKRKSSAKAANPDFKRIKAKVGKRAPRPANQTDTAVQFESLRLGPQSSSLGGADKTQQPPNNDSSQLLLSSRGSSVADLVSKLHHPAVAVRLSAIKGLKDIVRHLHTTRQPPTSSSSSNSSSLEGNLSPLLQTHLSAIVTAVTRCCCLDESDDVRTLSRLVLDDTLTWLGTTMRHNAAERVLQPLAPLVLALVQTALNSLDRDSRCAGVAVLELLSRRVPNVVAPAVDTLLPTFVRCFAERSTPTTKLATGRQQHHQVTPGKSKHGIGGSIASSKKLSGDVFLLQALLALLATRHQKSSNEAPSKEASSSSSSSSSLVTARVPYVHLTSNRIPYAFVITAPGSDTSTRAVGRMARRRVATLQKLTDLTTTLHTLTTPVASATINAKPATKPTAGTPSLTMLSSQQHLDCIVNLLEHLRDILVEAMQGSNPNSHGVSTTVMSLERIERVTLVAGLIRNLLKEVSDQSLIRLSTSSPLVTTERNPPKSKRSTTISSRFTKVNTQLSNVLLEGFPVRVQQPQQQQQQQHSSLSDATSVGTTLSSSSTAVNSEISSAILSIASCVGGVVVAPTILSSSDRLQSAQAVLSYVNQSLLVDMTPLPDDNGHGPQEGLEHIVELLCTMVRHQSVLFPNNETHQLDRVVECFGTTYFGSSGMSVPVQWARSISGRKTARLAMTMVQQYKVEHSAVMGHRVESLAIEICQKLPDYLMAWGSDFPSDTNAALSLIHEMFRKQSPVEIHTSSATHATTPLKEIAGMVLSVVLEWQPTLKQKHCNGEPRLKIIFEDYTESSQRLVVAILVLSEQLCPTTIQALGTICSRSHCRVAGSVSYATANLIQESVFRLRKTVPLSAFLGFVVDSTGATKAVARLTSVEGEDNATKGKPSFSIAAAALKSLEMDCSTKTVMRLLVECGSATKILSMLRPFLAMCVGQGSEWNRDSNLAHPISDVGQLRIALAVMALLSRQSESDAVHRQGESNDVRAQSTGTLPDNLHNLFADACIALLLLLWESRRSIDGAELSSNDAARLVQPLLALLSAVPTLMSTLFHRVLTTQREPDGDGTQNNLTEAFVDLLEIPGMADLVRDSAGQWLTDLCQAHPSLGCNNSRLSSAPESSEADETRSSLTSFTPAALRRLASELQHLTASSLE